MDSASQTSEAEKELERRRRQIIRDLQSALRRYRLVIIVGAGVTLGATRGPNGSPARLTWAGLIRNGLDYLVNDVYNGTQDDRIRRAYSALESRSAEGLSDAAMIMKARLEQSKRFPTWLTSVFRDVSDEIQDHRVLDALKRLHKEGAMLLTTNYDDILEKHCDLQRVGRSSLEDVLKFKSGDKDGIFHLHGSYEDPQEVVLDVVDYSTITHAVEVQNLLKTCMEDRTVLFVGCGSGLEDPNFGPLLKWFEERHKNISNRHCLLLRDDDPLDVSPLRKVKVGLAYEKLDSFLFELVEPPLQVAAPSTGTMNFGHPSSAGTPMNETLLFPEENIEKEAAKARELIRLKAEEEQRRKIRARQLQQCLASLSFPEMTQRRKSANRAFPGTCSWIQSHELYQKWLELQCGLLWVKGNPGSGKSTIMAFLFEEMIKASEQREPLLKQSPPANDRSILVLSFFFHGRGSPLEKSQVGMFRSLLHQILAPLIVGDLVEPICNQILKAFLENSAGGHGWEWQLEEVRSLFSSLVMTMANRRRVRIIVDALDEAGVEAANELLTYFHRLIQTLSKFEVDVRICIACRHYPVMEVDIPGYTIIVDAQNRLDIVKYVEQMINSNIPVKNNRDEITRNEIMRMISSRAGSSFQWACLIAPMAIRYHHNGESLDWIQERLAKVPPGLRAVYQHIFTVIIDEENMTPKRSLLLMQWISLAQRRLSLTELQFAMSSEDETDLLPLPHSDGARTANYNLTKERVTSWSGGLAEVVYTHPSKDIEDIQLSRHLERLKNEMDSDENYHLYLQDASGGSSLSWRLRRKKGGLDERRLRGHLEYLMAKKTSSGYVQFIHQSVNDYLVSEGLSLLLHLSNGRSGPNPEKFPISAATSVPRHHERLTNICLNYLQRKELEVDIFRNIVAYNLRRVDPMSYELLDKLRGHSNYLFERFDKAYKTFLQNANIRSIIIDVLFPFLSYVIEFWYVHVGNVENVASQYLPDFVKRLSSGIFGTLIAIGDVQRDTTFDGQKLIHFASSRSDMKMIVQLLMDGGQVSVKDAMNREALHYAIRYGQEEVVGMLLLGRPDVEARVERLSASAWSDMEASMAPLSASAPSAITPLQLAALHGYVRIMRLLLKYGVNRDSVSLKLAILRTDYDMVNLLLVHKWEVTNEHLYDALVSSSFEMFELLFKIGKCHLDINFRATNEPDSTMLHFAVRSANTKAVRLLLDNGAKVLTPFISGETMQEYAEFRCHYFQDRDDSQDFMEIERLFLQHRADLRTAAEEIVSWTSWKSDDVLRYLRTKGPAHTPLDLFKSRTPLHWASERMFTWAHRIGIEEFLQVLNACERDMHVQDRDGMTPLHIAATHGHLDLVEELVKKGSKILAEMRDGRTPLDCARNHSQRNVIAYLESVMLE